eukprot:1947195-Amphidinium_carterae.1
MLLLGTKSVPPSRPSLLTYLASSTITKALGMSPPCCDCKRFGNSSAKRAPSPIIALQWYCSTHLESRSLPLLFYSGQFYDYSGFNSDVFGRERDYE